MTVLTKASIREAERKAVESGIFSFEELMGIAGRTAADIIDKNFDIENKKIAVVCGNGNNGGDGFVCADVLKNKAIVDVIIPFGEPLTDNAKHYFEGLSGVNILHSFDNEYDIIIDALFGIGLNRPLDDGAINLIKKADYDMKIGVGDSETIIKTLVAML